VKFIVAKLVVDGLPDAEHRGLQGAHDVAHILSDRVVKPADALVDDGPRGIVALLGG
jgi:hypothetical protein